ncbi:M20/M25/M40 family metallo-hydrolase [Salinicoccus sp. ID82-1]|uniref:M20/M25/M40 family metallo-hydrolase n=1 Tax=Salinicoccus cyprini TaxID=2493691 RepID=A0A558AZ21_9STAP|nr:MULTISPECIES: M20/M25/M40 family metallo-hydrolase [Salinicoccus]MCG1009056.1 M20/M25/M40 family metallo-hydrolase [Salinicoccus sp. ID82-1]TVT29503.1 M20/M25/M40 family metallo-hydrolase [Salinicoccus cyprini]
MNQDRLVNQFMEMVKIDSETGYERDMADYLLATFKEMGIEAKEDDTQEKTGYGAGNILVRLEGDAAKAPVYFTVHMDTVAPGKGVRPSVEGDYIVSDGTTILGADDKAGIAALIEAIHTLKESGITHGDVEIVITVGEESGLVGAKAFDAGQLKSRFGYAIDSTGKVGTVVTAAPTQSRIEVNIHGKKAHAGVAPETGVSAINIAARAISQMKLGRIDEETTANIGRFEGGTATNVVTDHVHLLAEARSLDNAKMEAQSNHMKETFENVAREMGGRADVDVEVMYAALSASNDSEVVRTAVRAIENIGRNADLISLGGGSDGNIFAGAGIETAILGLGYENIHTTEEKMPIEELAKITELIVEIIRVQNDKEVEA